MKALQEPTTQEGAQNSEGLGGKRKWVLSNEKDVGL